MKIFLLILFLSGVAQADDKRVVDDLIAQAQAAMTAKKFDDAAALYEKVIVEHPEASDRWFGAQMGITQALCRKGDFAAAAKSAHLCLDGAPNLGGYDSAVATMAGILSALDKSVDRANAFIAFEQSGGATNPLDAVGYPAMPQREAAFAIVRQQAGEEAAASRLRAVTYLYSGKPRDALAQFADAFRRGGDNGLSQRVSDLVMIGLRDVRGNRLGLDEAVEFVVFGPNGPDGKAGTADDLADPFVSWLPAPPNPGEGGLANIPAADLDVLRQVHDAAQVYAGDQMLGPEIRRNALAALTRVTGALDGWGAPDQKEWYLTRALHMIGPHPDTETRHLLLRGAEIAARGRALNLGGSRELWDEVGALTANSGLQNEKTFVEDREQFDKLCRQISQTKFPPIADKPLKSVATFP